MLIMKKIIDCYLDRLYLMLRNERLYRRRNSFDETIKQKSTLGMTIPELITKHGQYLELK